MRVAVDARALCGELTGVGRYLEGLISAWLDAHPRDSFVLVSPRAISLSPVLAGRVEVLSSRVSLPGTVWLQGLAPALSRRAGADVFFGPLSVIPLASRLPAVATIHDLTPLLHPEWHNLKNRLGFVPFLAPTVRRARRLIAVSEATRRDLVTNFPDADAICSVVHNGVASCLAEPADSGAIPRNPYVLFLGTLEPRKNLERLVQAMESIWDRRPGFPDLLLGGGPGWGLDGFSSRISSSRHASRIVPYGYVPAGESAALIRNARLLAYPSLYEGFGLPPLEAMALGTVVVGSSSSSLPEVLGDAGLLPDPEDVDAIAAAIERAETDEPWRLSARRKGLERAAGLSWQICAERTRAVFESALS
ncbi:MAG: glycosyltransferase family 1 protein [Thermoanaerobaculia bacterium]